MRSWWHHDEHRLAGQDAQWIALRRALDPAVTFDRLTRKSEALLKQSPILREPSASLHAASALLPEPLRAARRVVPRRS